MQWAKIILMAILTLLSLHSLLAGFDLVMKPRDTSALAADNLQFASLLTFFSTYYAYFLCVISSLILLAVIVAARNTAYLLSISWISLLFWTATWISAHLPALSQLFVTRRVASISFFLSLVAVFLSTQVTVQTHLPPFRSRWERRHKKNKRMHKTEGGEEEDEGRERKKEGEEEEEEEESKRGREALSPSPPPLPEGDTMSGDGFPQAKSSLYTTTIDSSASTNIAVPPQVNSSSSSRQRLRRSSADVYDYEQDDTEKEIDAYEAEKKSQNRKSTKYTTTNVTPETPKQSKKKSKK